MLFPHPRTEGLKQHRHYQERLKLHLTSHVSCDEKFSESPTCIICLVEFIAQVVRITDTCGPSSSSTYLLEWSEHASTCSIYRWPLNFILVRHHLEREIVSRIAVEPPTSIRRCRWCYAGCNMLWRVKTTWFFVICVMLDTIWDVCIIVWIQWLWRVVLPQLLSILLCLNTRRSGSDAKGVNTYSDLLRRPLKLWGPVRIYEGYSTHYSRKREWCSSPKLSFSQE
jgi:hypothetical protein